MKGWNMFAEIKKYKDEGLNKSQVARKLGVDYKTVMKYWDMTPDEFARLKKKSESRKKKVGIYEEQILEWIKEYRDMSSAQIYDKLEEMHKNLDFKERTLRRYVNSLREENGLPKMTAPRQYEEIPELPMGHQAQVDLGQIWLTREDKSRIKVYCFAMVLSHSRYKYVYWTDRPFTTQSFVEAHTRAFAYFGGMPKEIVYDQDRVAVVSENHGDIIYTEGFQNYINSAKFKVYLCRGYDPETKGKIEAVVKYAKGNFAIHRTFHDIESLNEDSMSWLERRGNGKVHETTKRIPAEVFALEKEHLLPVPTLLENRFNKNILTYLVRKNNTVCYKQNRYQVPKGTYKPGKQVELNIVNGTMEIVGQETGELIARHKVSLEKGQLVRLERESLKSQRKDEVYEKVLQQLGLSEVAVRFLDGVKSEKSRHFKDQSSLIMKTIADQEQWAIQRALIYCTERKLFSAGLLKDTIAYLKLEKNRHENKKYFRANISTPSKYRDLRPQIRDIREYTNAFKEENEWES